MLTGQEFDQLDTALQAMHQIDLGGMGFSGPVVSLHNVRVLVSKFSQADAVTVVGADERAEQLGEMFAELYSKEAKSWGWDRRALAEVAKIIREAEAARDEVWKSRIVKLDEEYETQNEKGEALMRLADECGSQVRKT